MVGVVGSSPIAPTKFGRENKGLAHRQALRLWRYQKSTNIRCACPAGLAMALRQRWTSRAKRRSLDGVLVQWGDRLFYPGNRIVKPTPAAAPLGGSGGAGRRSSATRIEATVVRRAPQVMVKVTGGGRGMKAIAAHFRYISKNGRLEIEDERGQLGAGKEAVRELVEDWRFGGSLIDGRQRPARGVQHHAVDAARHRPADACSARRASSRRPSSPTTST